MLVSTQTPGKARFGAPVEPSTQPPRRQAVPNEKKRRSPSPSETPAYANRAAGARLSADELAVATRLFYCVFFPGVCPPDVAVTSCFNLSVLCHRQECCCRVRMHAPDGASCFSRLLDYDGQD